MSYPYNCTALYVGKRLATILPNSQDLKPKILLPVGGDNTDLARA